MFRLNFLIATLTSVTFCMSASLASEPLPCAYVQNTPRVKTGPSLAPETQFPDEIKKPATIIPLGCERPFAYRGQIYSADTPQAQDASTLRNFMLNVPQSKALMDQYQSNRAQSRIGAYTGTAGVVIFLLSNVIFTRFDANTRTAARTAIRIGGLSLAAGGFIYSFALLRSNEFLIPRAVNAFNEANPKDPIELQFSTSWGF